MKNKFNIGDRCKDKDSGYKGTVSAYDSFVGGKLRHVSVNWDKGAAEPFVSIRDLIKLKKKSAPKILKPSEVNEILIDSVLGKIDWKNDGEMVIYPQLYYWMDGTIREEKDPNFNPELFR